MKLLQGKTALVFGIANRRSIAWGIAQALHQHGARLGVSYAGPALEKRVRPLAESIGCSFIEPCDVSQDDQIQRVAEKAAGAFGEVDILVHAIAFAKREELMGTYCDTSREGFRLAMDISVYSFVALAQAFHSLLRPGSALLTLTYHGARKVAPHYNVMGVAKAALEASVRYLAHDFGPEGVRVNAISAGPVRTLAASGIAGFRSMYHRFAEIAPLQKNVTPDDIGGAAAFLSSDLAAMITGEVLYVDAGYNIMGVLEPPDSDAA
jgi:enoyl-[acyl-carrier protein] reductase I